MTHRITRLRVRDVRAFRDVTLDLSRSVTVLIGPNGSGKSTLVECLELLHRAAEPGFLRVLHERHGGPAALVRHGAPGLELGVRIESDAGGEPPVEYEIRLGRVGGGAVIDREVVREVHPRGRTVDRLVRRRDEVRAWASDAGGLKPLALPPDETALAVVAPAPPHPAVERLLTVLRGLEVHAGLDTMPGWVAVASQREVAMRGAAYVRPATRLSLLGRNLVNAWMALRNAPEPEWTRTRELLRLGLGDVFDDVEFLPTPSGGHVEMFLRLADAGTSPAGEAPRIPTLGLSDGQLAWLAFLAMTRLHAGRSLLAVDEPELHLHPALLARVVDLFRDAAEHAPVLVCTHADRVLEALDDPADALRLCDLEPDGTATVGRLDREGLDDWLERFGGVAGIRDAGLLELLREGALGGPPRAETTG